MENSSTKEFARQFSEFIETMKSEAATQGNSAVFLNRVSEHFGQSPSQLPVIMEDVEDFNHINFQRALDDFIEKHGYSVQVIGYQAEYAMAHASLSALLNPSGRYYEGPVRYTNFYLDESDPATAFQNALLLLSAPSKPPLVLLISGPRQYERQLHLEVMATDKSSAQSAFTELRERMAACNAYRGKVISVSSNEYRQLQVRVHQLPEVQREDIILQPGVLDQVERLTIRFADRAERLRQANRHIKRGLLLYGPPGTGKTYTAMYLATAMKDRTVLLMTGLGMGLLESTVALARSLAPAMVVLEDVDLIGEERSSQSGCTVPLLFELLNQMDGLASDTDVIFLLTTNRPDILEPALASRPGRIDQAIEIPVPDAECRRKLFSLYGNGLSVELEDETSLINRTEGASAAFIKEMFRRAALYGDDNGSTISVTDRHFDEALHELLARGGQLTQSLLGFKNGN